MKLGTQSGKNSRLRAAILRAGAWGAVFALAGCAWVDQATLKLTSTHVKAFVVVDATVLEGKVTLYPDRTGLLQADSVADSKVHMSCSGQMHYTSSKAGLLRLSCNNGTIADLNYQALDYTRGYGRIRDPDRVVSVTFGMDARESQGWLWAPTGQHVVAEDDRLLVEAKPTPTPP